MKLLLALSVITLVGCASGPTPEEQLASQQAEIARLQSICGELWDTDEDLEACMNRRLNRPQLAVAPARVEQSSNTAAIIGAILLGGAQGYSRGLQENTYVIPDYHQPEPSQEMDYTNPKTGQVIRTSSPPPMGFY